MSPPLPGFFTCSITVYFSMERLCLNALKCMATGFFYSLVRLMPLYSDCIFFPMQAKPQRYLIVKVTLFLLQVIVPLMSFFFTSEDELKNGIQQ